MIYITVENADTEEKIAEVDFYYDKSDDKFILEIFKSDFEHPDEVYKIDNPVPNSHDVDMYEVRTDTNDYWGIEIRTVIDGEEEVGPAIRVEQRTYENEERTTEVYIYEVDSECPDDSIELCNIENVNIY